MGKLEDWMAFTWCPHYRMIREAVKAGWEIGELAAGRRGKWEDQE
jgi:hypothetical protein